MRNSPDPSIHRQRQQQMIAHVEQLLDDDRLRVDTAGGRRPIAGLPRQVNKLDRGMELKRLMSEMGRPDRQLENAMPAGQTMTVELSQKRRFFFTRAMGRLQVICLSPTRELIAGQEPSPLTPEQTRKMLAEIAQQMPPPLKNEGPVTMVVMSTCGFTLEAHELAERRAERTMILVEPNDTGGWNVYGPTETKALNDLLNPETEQARRDRVRQYIADNAADLLGGGISTDRIAGNLQLPAQDVEAELKSYARENPGLAAQRIDGRVILFRQGTTASAHAIDAGGINMPFWEKLKSIFRRQESAEQKIARLAAERAGLTQQRERCYEEIAVVEKKEQQLAAGFASATALAQRRIATEIAQLRKDLGRRQQLLDAIDKKVNIVNSAVHSLELKKEVDPERLKRFENLIEPSEELEEGLAALQQMDEEANAMTAGPSEVPDDVAAIMAELQGKAAAESTAAQASATGASSPAAGGAKSAESARAQPATTTPPRRSEPQAG